MDWKRVDASKLYGERKIKKNKDACICPSSFVILCLHLPLLSPCASVTHSSAFPFSPLLLSYLSIHPSDIFTVSYLLLLSIPTFLFFRISFSIVLFIGLSLAVLISFCNLLLFFISSHPYPFLIYPLFFHIFPFYPIPFAFCSFFCNLLSYILPHLSPLVPIKLSQLCHFSRTSSSKHKFSLSDFAVCEQR